MKIKAEVDLDNFWNEFEDSYTYTLSQELKKSLQADALKQLKASPEYKKAVLKVQNKLLESVLKQETK